jgi:hypothetical protein
MLPVTYAWLAKASTPELLGNEIIRKLSRTVKSPTRETPNDWPSTTICDRTPTVEDAVIIVKSWFHGRSGWSFDNTATIDDADGAELYRSRIFPPGHTVCQHHHHVAELTDPGDDGAGGDGGGRYGSSLLASFAEKGTIERAGLLVTSTKGKEAGTSGFKYI